MNFDLSDEEHAAPVRVVNHAIDEDCFPYAPRVDPLKATLAKLRPEAVAELPLPLNVYAPPKTTAARRRG